MECDRQESRHYPISPRTRSTSPNKHDSVSHGSQYRQKSRGRHFGRRDKIRYHYMDILASKNGLHNAMPVRRARGSGGLASSAPSDIKMWYRIQRIDDEELRRRLLECEARVERWERAFEYQSRLLQKTIQDSQQQQQQRERRQFFFKAPPMPHYGYEYPKDSRINMEDSC